MNGLTIYSDQELKKIQKLELDVLIEIIRICEELDIEYFLIGGTALGAVRHNGFIPWDDDIDVGMRREDYEYFLEKVGKMLSSKYELQTPYDKNIKCPYSYTKIRIHGTKFVEYCNRNLNMQQGVYVDIFPFDEVPDDESLNLKQFKTVQFWKKLYVIHESPDVTKQPDCLNEKMKFVIRRGLHYISKILPKKLILGKIDSVSKMYNGTGQSAVACLDFPIRKKEYVEIENLYPLKKVKFESIYACIPNNHDVYLTHHYNDYMKLPDSSLRFGHKPYRVDLGND